MNFYNENDPHAAAWLRELIAAGLIAPGVVDQRDIQQLREVDLGEFTQVHLFAGIGGWSYALRLAGWPDDYPVWTGSCPCQPYSAAGKGKGDEDPRNLWPEMFWLVRKYRPVVCLGEQVESAVGHGWLDGVSADLEAENYAVGSIVLGAHSVGAPHIRQRLFWVADSGSAECRWRAESTGEYGRAFHASNRCGDGGLADSKYRRQANEESRAEFGAQGGGMAGRLADSAIVYGPEHVNNPRERTEGGTDYTAKCRAAGGMVNAIVPRLEGHSGDGDNGNKSRRLDTPSAGSTSETGSIGFWGNDFIPCRDGKARRFKPGIFPLAHGVSGRVGLLRGAGNAICPQTAAAFIAAYVEAAQ